MSKIISSYYTDGKPANRGAQANKGRRTAIGYWVNGRAVVSFPARLNNQKIPSLNEAAAIVRGDSVAEACERFNLGKSAATVAAPQWEKERDELGWVHHLPTGTPGYWVKVEKTPAGDYTVTARNDDDIAGGDVEYRDNLRAAKRFGESLVKSGAWVDYTMFPDEARAALAAPRVTLEKPAAAPVRFFGIKHNGGAFVEVFRMLESDEEKTLSYPLSFTSAAAAAAHVETEFPERERRAYRIEPHAEHVTMTHEQAIAEFMAQESNAVVMARAVAVVRDRRLAAEYVAAKDGDDLPGLDLSALENLHREAAALNGRIDRAERAPTGDDYNALYSIVMRYAVPLVVHVVEPISDDEENRRALDAEEARAAAARKLAGA